MSVNLNRNFKNELNSFAQKHVVIHTTTGKEIKGMLLGLNTDDMSIVLGDAEVDNKQHHRIFLSGPTVAEIYLGEAPFNISGLRTELEKVFKKSGVRYYDDTKTLVVMDRYTVSEAGVEGEGPVADRVRRIWQNFKKKKDEDEEKEKE